MNTLNTIYLAHYSKDLLKIVSKDIVQQAKHLLPDLRKVTIFVPNQLSQNLLRAEILKQTSLLDFNAVLPPTITTLKKWVRSQQETHKPALSQYARELILVDAIKQQPELFSDANPWSIADELLSLFDAMLLNDVQPREFKNYYKDDNDQISHALLHEADLINILWVAWRHQISDENYLDPVQVYADALNTIDIDEQGLFYCLGLDQLSKLEFDFINKIERQSKLLFFTYASNCELNQRTDNWLRKYCNDQTDSIFFEKDENNNYSSFLDEVYSDSTLGIKQRAENFSKSGTTDPLNKILHVYKTNQFEQHTKAIDIQIRLWINENRKNIGVVTTDRKLARRLRSMLEHANVAVNDAAGWALATTSAAVIVEWWLQLTEERYPAKQLLALSNSPFFPVIDKDTHEKAINFFEKEIILKFNLHSGIHRYRNAIDKVQAKHPSVEPIVFDYLIELLDKFEASAQLLAKLHGSKNYPLYRFINELLNSLKPIGLYTALSNDEAGKQIIDLFEDQIAHFKLIDNSMSWSESRRFMSRIFDQQNYKPPVSSTSVTFCSLEQSRLQRFDALVIASVDKNNFPGTNRNYIFFNEQVRSELKIPTWRDEHARHLHHFRCLLDSSNTILITVQTEKNGEPTSQSPWLEAIETFYRIAYKNELTNFHLESLAEQEASNVTKLSELPLPAHTVQPGPILLPEIKPSSVSISQYQSLVNCPYQYFVSSCLNLAPSNELKDELNKADFGSLVHQCIHAFFNNVPNFPGPFANKVTSHTRIEAENTLRSISQDVFSRSTETEPDNEFINKLWLYRWLNLVPKFISWEIERESNYTPIQHEASKSLKVNESSEIHGRLDRIDRSNDGYSIIDYKTGETPTKKSIVAGEQVQLPMYAILNESNTDETTHQVEFVTIGKDNSVKSAAIIRDDELEILKAEHVQRLQEFFNNLDQQTPFVALASSDTCERCNAYGICRKSYWEP